MSEIEPGLLGITINPSVGIGQRALLVQTPSGNLLWDSTGYVDDDLAEQVAAAGGIAAVAASHPHMFGVQTAWSRRFGDAPVYVAEADGVGAAARAGDHDLGRAHRGASRGDVAPDRRPLPR